MKARQKNMIVFLTNVDKYRASRERLIKRGKYAKAIKMDMVISICDKMNLAMIKAISKP
jgi:hypothetical protein